MRSECCDCFGDRKKPNCHSDLSLKSALFLPLSEESLAMANYDENPFAGDSENPFAVSICGANKLIRGGIYNLLPLVWSCTFLLEAKLQFTVRWGMSFVF